MNPIELYAAVLEKLEAIGQGQTAHAADTLKVHDGYQSLHQQLTDAQLVDWTVDDDVPQWAEQIMVCMVAAVVMGEFGVDSQRMGQLAAEGGWNMPDPSLAERQLRKHQAAPYISTPARPDYF